MIAWPCYFIMRHIVLYEIHNGTNVGSLIRYDNSV